jgi:hypothetical protein
MRIAVVLIGLMIGGWLTFDGTRALIKGDYVTSKGGQLGPWSRVVSAAGIDPRGKNMKGAHVELGILWVAAVAIFVTQGLAGRTALLGCSVLTLWYLPMGTILSVIMIGLLLTPRLRAQLER